MTLTIELPEEIVSRLKTEAESKHESVDRLCERLLSGIEKPKRVLHGRGMLAGGKTSVDDFLREKHEETRREEEALGWR